MSRAERLALADKLAARHQLLVEFTKTATVLLGLLPLLYGGLTWLFGVKLWEGNDVYGTALGVPGAPQSWGTLFLLLGGGTIAAAHWERRRCIAILTTILAVVMATFMTTFITEYVADGTVSALIPGMVYGVVSLLFLARARLAWAGRHGLRHHWQRWKGRSD